MIILPQLAENFFHRCISKPWRQVQNPDDKALGVSNRESDDTQVFRHCILIEEYIYGGHNVFAAGHSAL
jgi:hypothetical protein